MSLNEQGYPSAMRAWYTVSVLVLAYIFSFVDRQILTLLVGPIRQDLGVSDIQISVLQGFAFVILYTFLGFPLGRLADRINRRNLIRFPQSYRRLDEEQIGFRCRTRARPR